MFLRTLLFVVENYPWLFLAGIITLSILAWRSGPSYYSDDDLLD